MLHLDLDVDLLNVYVIIFLAVVALFYIFVDVNYFLRTIGVVLFGTYVESRIKVEEVDELPGFCTSQDMDFMLSHMNNARYIREADFGRFHWFARTGLLTEIRNSSGHILQGACTIRYRKPIPLFSFYKLKTKVLYWDEKNVYFEQQFCTSDGFIRAIMFSQNKIINIDIPQRINKLLGKDPEYRAEIPEELQMWIDSLQASSKKLRKKD